MMDDATTAQNIAADPRLSTWLAANAGSGKTRVLTDRVARLLLGGTEPQNILCLTYTKAAASEMQNRLFARLGEWSMLDDADLRAELANLGETPPDDLTRARTLFARAIETPGGLKIQTIHSFCSSVLRQFPLEAGVSPQFRELDETGQTELLDAILDDLAITAPDALAGVSRIHSDNTLTDLARAVAKRRDAFGGALSRDEIFTRLGIDPSLNEEDLVRKTVSDLDLAFLRNLAPILAASDKSTDLSLAAQLAGLPTTATSQTIQDLDKLLLSQSGNNAFQPKSTPPTKALRTGPLAEHMDRFTEIAQRVADIRQTRLTFAAAQHTHALHSFARALLPAYDSAKTAAGTLDFDDLIEKTKTLLTTQSLEWVLFRLDGGIEHILVDEAQDTSPAQWEVIDALAREITAGEGRDGQRTLFVVGDKKQSIYSFQGADARAFDHMQVTFGERLSHGPKLQNRELLYSFRSSRAILESVDTVFDGPAGQGLGQDILHRAFKEALPGRVDLWPLAMKPEKEMKPEWYDPVDMLAPNDPRIVLADKIAETIESLIGKETITDKKGHARLIRAGDILILVRGRSDLFDHIIRSCKSRNLAVAGADRLKIAGELAVKDLLALLSFLALQEDSLSLAAALRSPLFGWSERDLYDLAQGRRQRYLWAELRDRKGDFPETVATLQTLLDQVDFQRPFELLDNILTRFDGRRNLLARLGPEAEDGIDELLNQALMHERDSIPSLTTFLTQARSDDAEIKRQSDSSGDLIRVMTVHGAKGLEAPIVILPDTTRKPEVSRDSFLVTGDGLPVWNLPNARCPDCLLPAKHSVAEAAQEERQRLLYVAMTRAESWLIVCGVETKQSGSTWYKDVEDGLSRLPTIPLDTPLGEGKRFAVADWPGQASAISENETIHLHPLPDFLQRPAPQPEATVRIWSPSDLEGDKHLGGGMREREAALRHGRQIHRLLELLPGHEASDQTAFRLLASGEDPAMEQDIASLHAEAAATIAAHPDVFAPDTLAEVDVAAFLPTLHGHISGVIDRLILSPDRVIAVDFKTNPIVPDRPEDTPEGILRQMGAYLEALEQIFPDRAIELHILWTANATRTVLPHAIVRDALSRAPTS